MSDKESEYNFQKIFEEHPIKACIGCFSIGIGVSYTILTFLYDGKIQNITNRYEDKIESLRKFHEQDLQINEIKLKNEDGIKYYLNIDATSKLADDINNLIESDKNDK